MEKTNNVWISTLGFLREMIFPTRCFFCKKFGEVLCVDCQSLLEISPTHRPDRNLKYLDGIYAACSYDNRFVQKIVHEFKYEPFLKTLGAALAGIIDTHLKLLELGADFGAGSVIVPVPLAQRRLRWRGYNQAEVIAQELAKLWDTQINTASLIRTRETEIQMKLAQTERRENIKNAFACQNNDLRNKAVLLVDDVATTGATMEECARVLLKNGARQVTGICVARTEN